MAAKAKAAVSAPPDMRSANAPVKAPPPSLDDTGGDSKETVPFRINERGQPITLATRQYDNMNVTIINVGHANTAKAAEQQVLIKGVIR